MIPVSGLKMVGTELRLVMPDSVDPNWTVQGTSSFQEWTPVPYRVGRFDPLEIYIPLQASAELQFYRVLRHD